MWERAKTLTTSNLSLKLVSLAVAVLLYSMSHGGQDARGSITVDLEVNSPPDSGEKVLVGNLPRDVRIYVRGSSQVIDNLRASSIHMIADLRDAPTRVVFRPEMVRVPDGVRIEVEQFEPASIELRWEPRVTRDVLVQVTAAGTLPEGLVLKGGLVPTPRTVKVSGPRSDVVVLQNIHAEAFDVRSLTGEGKVSRQLALERPSAKLRVEPESITVGAEVVRELAERSFPRLPVAVVGVSKGKTLPAEVDVKLQCPPEVVRHIRPEQVVPRVEVGSKEAAGSVLLPVAVHFPSCEASVTPRDVVVRW